MKTLCKPYSKPVQTPRKPASRPRWNPQIGKYQKMWEVIFQKYGWADRPEKEKQELRHSIIEDLFGEYIKPSFFDNRKWDIVYFALELITERGILVWSKEMAAYASEEGLRRVYINRIEHAGEDIPEVSLYSVPEVYIAHVANGKFGHQNWRALSAKQLEHLFWTIKNRVRAANNKGRNLHSTPPPVNDNYAETNPDDPF